MSDLRDHSQPCEHGEKYYHKLQHPEHPPSSGRFVACPGGREVTIEQMVERMAESRYNARFGGFAWTDPNHVTEGYTRDAFMASAERDLAAAIGDTG